MTQTEYVGPGSIDRITDILAKEQAKKIFLVTGKHSYQSTGAAQWVRNNLAGKFELVHWQDFTANPKIEDIERGIVLIRQHTPDIVLAIGGGSVIDMAKNIHILANQSGDLRDYIMHKKELVPAPNKLIAVPTTAGTGSEATKFAVVYIDQTKYSLEHDIVVPAYVVVDSALTMSLPASVTAETGMDALCQAIESYWSVGSTDESKSYAAKAIGIIVKQLPVAVVSPTAAAREQMSYAANLAGKAINISRTTACHAISYPMTAYFGIPHGHAVALTLSEVLAYNSAVTDTDVQDPRGVAYVQKIMQEIFDFLGASDVASAKEVIHALMRRIGLATALSALHIAESDIDMIVQHGGNPDRMKNNPRRLEKDNLRQMLLRLL